MDNPQMDNSPYELASYQKLFPHKNTFAHQLGT